MDVFKKESISENASVEYYEVDSNDAEPNDEEPNDEEPNDENPNDEDEDNDVEIFFESVEQKIDQQTNDNIEDLSCIMKCECGICTDMFLLQKMFVPIYCNHKICRPCAEQYYESQIRNRGVLDITCPYPVCTDLSVLDPLTKQEYFALTSTQLKQLLSTEVMDLFERKLRDWSLSSIHDFMWCPKCDNGVIVDEVDSQKYMTCTQCASNVCTDCRKEWTEAHVGLTCVQYEKWLEANDPSTQEKKLDKYLIKHGIECPKCRMRFIKPSGGCLHLKCPMSSCHHEFCEGCLQPFLAGKLCKLTERCASLGLHAHHPRNCFYFLRDWDPVKLQRLLQSHSVLFETESLCPISHCQIIEQKDTSEGLVDEPCGVQVEPFQAGYCRNHYVRYLAQLVLNNGIDPVVAYEIDELEVYLNNNNIPYSANGVKSQEYQTALIKLVQSLGDMKLHYTTQNAGNNNSDLTNNDDSLVSLPEGDAVKDAEGACAPGVVAPRLPSPEPGMWRCAFCTYDNPLGTPICIICCRTQTMNENFEVYEDGIECTTCTLINDPRCIYCIACSQRLRRSL